MKLRWLFAAGAALLVIVVGWLLLSEQVAIDSCLDSGGAWRDKYCVYR